MTYAKPLRPVGGRAIEADVFQRFVDFFERLLAEVRDAQRSSRVQCSRSSTVNTPRSSRQLVVRTARPISAVLISSLSLQVLRLLVGAVQRDACHGGFPPFVNMRCVAGLRRDFCGVQSPRTIVAEVYQVSNAVRTILRQNIGQIIE